MYYFSILYSFPPFISPGGPNLQNVPSFLEKLASARLFSFRLKLETEETHRVSPAGRRPPAAGKLAVGAARRIGGDGIHAARENPGFPALPRPPGSVAGPRHGVRV